MTDRLADVGARIHGIQQLGAVVNAMRGIAAARAQQARSQLAAVDAYATTIAAAIGTVLSLTAPVRADGGSGRGRPALVVFCAEQGFAGAFSERVLDTIAGDLPGADLFLIGTRGAAVAAERGITASWRGPMPSHGPGVPRLADQIAEALYTPIAGGAIDRLDAVFSRWQPGRGTHIERRRLFPFEAPSFTRRPGVNAPLLNLSPDRLLSALAADYMHAQLCDAALHALAAENEARMAAMTGARHQIEQRLDALLATQRLVRQEEITAEIIELSAGETASRNDPAHVCSGGAQ